MPKMRSMEPPASYALRQVWCSMSAPTLDKCAKKTPYSRNQSWEERLWTKIRIGAPEECWPWMGHLSGSGRQKHGAMSVHGTTKSAHRLVYTVVKGPIPPGLVIRHACDNPLCCNPSHLDVGTQRENIQDCLARGRFAALATNAEQANKIRKLHLFGLNDSDIGLLLGVSKHVVRGARTSGFQHLAWPVVVSKHERPYIRNKRIVGNTSVLTAVLGEKA